VGFQGRGFAAVVQPNCCHPFLLEALLFQWPSIRRCASRTMVEHKTPKSNKSVRGMACSSQDWLDLREHAAAGLARETASRQEYWELVGCDGLPPSTATLAQLEAVIQALQHAKRDIKFLARHTHDWGPRTIHVNFPLGPLCY
jgi:hypothetical protein